jgi:ATP-binding cassette subfamily C (CFTR/MRP) protein 4
MTIFIAIILTLVILIFIYSRPVVIKTKELDLQTKSPLFHYFGETINGLLQIRVYNQRMSRIQEISEIINKSTKGSISADLTTRGFAFSISFIALCFMLLGMLFSLYLLNPHKTHLYSVSVIYFITISEGSQWLLRQFIVVEGLMVSAERILRFS